MRTYAFSAKRVGCVVVAMTLLVLGVGCRPLGPDTPTMQRIESAAFIIEFPNQRLDLLKRIARQPDLLPHEQIYLVNTIMPIGFSSDRADALLNLIENPCCTPETMAHIRRSLKITRMFGKDIERVLRALDKAEDRTRT